MPTLERLKHGVMMLLMRNAMSCCVGKWVKGFLNDIDAPIIGHDRHEWTTTSQLCKYFGFDRSRPRRDYGKFPDALCQLSYVVFTLC